MKRTTCWPTAIALFGLSSQVMAQGGEREFLLDIEKSPLVETLNEFSKQTGIQVTFFSESADAGLPAGPLKGMYTAESALTKLLSRSGLIFAQINERTITIKSATRNSGQDIGTGFLKKLNTVRSGSPTQARWLSTSATDIDTSSRADGNTNTADDADAAAIEELVVTGSLIRGSQPIGSPVVTISREDIERSGFVNAQQLTESLPQNYRGKTTEESLSVRGGVNINRGAGVNLRGLGESATLVLLNGRRLAPNGGYGGAFVDISSLPLSAIERVEVLTDGASATYGSDAIGGVVNFILRDNYDGLETKVRGGRVTDGNLREMQASQIVGKVWQSGNLLLSYDYYERGNLESSERDFASNSDLRAYGGGQWGSIASNPGNISAPAPAAIPFGQDGTSLTSADLLNSTNFANIREGVDLLPEQERHSLLLTAEHELSQSVGVFADARLSRRKYEVLTGGEGAFSVTVPDSNPYFVTPVPGATSVLVNYSFIDDFGPQRHVGDVTGVGTTAGFRIDLTDRWRSEIYGTYDDEKTDDSVRSVNLPNFREALGFDDPSTAFNPATDGYFNVFADGSNTPRGVLDHVGNGFNKTSLSTDLWSANFKADGPLFSIPGGTLKLAVGGEYREESIKRFASTLSGTEVLFNQNLQLKLSREISAGFAELLIPVVGNGNAIPGIELLDLSAAYRYEQYSDFGSTNNPKFGLRWSPFNGISARASYGTSFRAPSFHDLAAAGAYIVSSIPSPAGGTVRALRLTGNNPDLGPETSTFWTAGLDFHSDEPSRLNISATYFDIKFDNRIGTVGSSTSQALLRPDLFAPVTTVDPDPAVVQEYLNSPFFIGVPPPASDIRVIVDGRIRNLAVTEMKGADLTASVAVESKVGTFNFGLNSTYILKSERAVTTTAPVFDVNDTIGNPPDLRLRGNVSWVYGGLATSVFVNYMDSYKDNISVPARGVSSWTTLDINMMYEPGVYAGSTWLQGLRLSGSIQNLLDKDPPFANSSSGVAYDPDNASPLGRFVSLQLTKQW